MYLNYKLSKEIKMKRIALVAALLALGLTACGQKAAETAPAPAPAPAPVAAPAASAPAATSAPVAAPAAADKK
ncbi:MAG: hypothetical protein WBM09_10950 [Gallionella sp.]